MTDLVLRDVTVVDVEQSRTVSHSSIYVRDGVIAAIGAQGDEVLDQEHGGEAIDCAGRYVMPGLIDTHVHLSSLAHAHLSPAAVGAEGADGTDGGRPLSVNSVRESLAGFLYCGVTSVFDAGNFGDAIFAIRDAERSGELAGPRVFCAGPFVTCPHGHGSQHSEIVPVSSLPGDSELLERHFARRPDLVKVTYDEHAWGRRPMIPVLDRSTLGRVVEAAHDQMLRVIVHVSNEPRAREAVAAGADALAHPVVRSPTTPEFEWLLAAKRIPVVSTLARSDYAMRLVDDPSFLDDLPYTRVMSDVERNYEKSVGRKMHQESARTGWWRAMMPIAQDNLRRLVGCGGIVATGTDVSTGALFYRELQLLEDAGIPTWSVLRCATVNGAMLLGKLDSMGSIAVGKVADLLVLDNDPTETVANIQSISCVIKGGSVVDRSADSLGRAQ